MRKLICPHCEKPAISAMRKMWLGPTTSATCQACGKQVSVPYISILAVIPFLVGILGATHVEAFAVQAAIWLGGFLVMAAIYMLWVPLAPR